VVFVDIRGSKKLVGTSWKLGKFKNHKITALSLSQSAQRREPDAFRSECDRFRDFLNPSRTSARRLSVCET
jgi:hypothetical protein